MRTISRFVFAAIALFWCAMNWMLWRSEMGGLRGGATPVSPEVVLGRVLTAPDPSTLEIRYQGRSVGYLHWYPDPGDGPAPRSPASEYVPEGMVRELRSYELRLEGNLQSDTLGWRMRFQAEWTLDTNRTWKTLSIRVGAAPVEFKLLADVAEGRVEWSLKDGEKIVTHTMSLDALQDPRLLLAEIGGPLAAFLAGPTGELAAGNTLAPMHWNAWIEWAPLGNSRVRVFRLQASWLDRYGLVLLVNRAGEILKAELPNGLRLVNEGLSGF